MLNNLKDRINDPHNGKNIIFIDDDDFAVGVVMGRNAYTRRTPLTELDQATRLSEVARAADGLGQPPYKIEEMLQQGKMVIFKPRKVN